MKKQIFLTLLILVFLFCLFAVPASAAELPEESSIQIVQQPVDHISNTYLNVTFSVTVSGDVSSYLWQYSFDGENWAPFLGANNSGRTPTVIANLSSNYNGMMVRCRIIGSDGSEVYTDVVYFYHSVVPFLFVVSRSISSVISWINSVVTALVSSEGVLFPLLPVLAIGISVTFILLVIKIFKSISWGL